MSVFFGRKEEVLDELEYYWFESVFCWHSWEIRAIDQVWRFKHASDHASYHQFVPLGYDERTGPDSPNLPTIKARPDTNYEACS